MITQSGVHIQKCDGVAGTPTALDIAVHAGRICRFGGAVWEPLLAHLVFVGLLAYRRSGVIENLIWGFLHDAAEIATGDIVQPFKCDCMRFQQKAIDERVLAYFFGDYYAAPIDYELVKQCDDDACDIEAVMLGVPGFSEIELKYTKDYRGRTSIHGSAEDKELFQRIFGSAFYNDTLDGRYSPGVTQFAVALDLAAAGEYEELRIHVSDWGML